MSKKIEFIDLGLPSGRLWATENEEGYFTNDKAKEKFDPKTFQPFDKVLSKYYIDREWTCGILSHPYYHNEFNGFIVNSNFVRYCIPYNEETKHLVGTLDDCPEYYKWWED